MTDTTGALAAALAEVQSELPELERDKTVEVEKKSGGTYSYSYVTLANLYKAILPLLAKHGLAFASFPSTGGDGKMCVRYYLLHKSGEQLSGEFPISGEGGIQMIGGRITYTRRYALAAVVGVAADEDDESQLADSKPSTAKRAAQPRKKAEAATQGRTAQRQQAAAPPPLPGEEPKGLLSRDQSKKIHALFNDRGLDKDHRDERLAYTAKVIGRQIATSNELTASEAHKVIEALLHDTEQEKEPPAEDIDEPNPNEHWKNDD